ncbi:MAG TPA: twin-arginine translocase TatA/TatE family subunit [Candidatus Binataceae bacterium]|nr:twin-arginine translocase TatA/TatE family subunit [Candidatus Binataceae bacterium]
MGDLLAPWHLLVILVIVLVIFGPSKLGDVGGALGKAIRDFKKAMNDEEAPKPVQKTAEPAPTPTPADNNPIKPV